MPRSSHRLSVILVLMLIGRTWAEESRHEPVILRDRIGEVDIEALLPAGVTTYRGVIWHAMNARFRADDRWAALAQELGFIRVVTSIDRRATNRPTKLRNALDQALATWAEAHGHPELPYLPLTGSGHSAGGMVLGAMLRTPQRTLTAAIDCSWIADPTQHPEEAANIPLLFTLGAIPDGFNMLPGIDAHFVPARAAGRPWGLGLQHGCAHNFGNAATLHIQWIQSVARLRLPSEVDPQPGPIPLNDIPLESGWLGDRDSIHAQNATIAAWDDYDLDRTTAIWFPDRATAMVWRAWQTKDTPVQLHMSREGWNLTPFAPRRSWSMPAADGQDVTLAIRADDTVSLSSVRWYAGDQILAERQEAPWEATWVAQSGCHLIWAEWTLTDGQIGTTNPATVFVPTQRRQD